MKIRKLIVKTRFLPMAYFIMLLVIFILPYYSFPEYSSTKNTISHLGSQFAPYAIYMNATFFILGAASIIDGWRRLRSFWFHKIVLLVFGASLIACAFFQHASIIEVLPYNVHEDKLHSLFASITGFSFVIFAIACSFIIKGWFHKIVSLLIGITAMLLSILMFEVEDFMGVWQRMIFIISFGWMVYIFNNRRALTLKPRHEN